MNDIRYSSPQIGVGHAVEHGLDLGNHLFQGPFGVDPFGLDRLDGPAVEHFVFEKNFVGFEDIVVVTQLFGRLLHNGLQVVLGFFYRGLEAFDLFVDVALADGVLFDDIHAFAADQVGFADADSRRGGDAFKGYFAVVAV